MPVRYRVTKDWTATYGDPIVLDAGECVELDGRQDSWDGHRWLWARSGSNKEGWIPDNLLVPEGGRQVARERYSAAELTCKCEETLTALKETHGWVECRSSTGEVGWVPRKNLRSLSD